MSNTYTVVVGEKGQITVPAELRKKYGITKGAVLLIEDNGNRLTFTPTIIFPKYNFDWDEEAKLAEQDIASGNIKRYSSDDYLSELDNRISEKERLLSWAEGTPGQYKANPKQEKS
jgi:AbrB family looped-hinge helix DNA binding protein